MTAIAHASSRYASWHSLKQLLTARDLIWAWTGRTIGARYQQSLMGWLWAVVQPAASCLVFTVVFTLFVRVDTGGIPYPVFSYVALLPWTFFASALPDMADSIVQNMSLITKIYFPREALLIAALLARVLDFAIASGLLMVLLIVYQVPVYPVLWLYLPLVFLVQIALLLGLGLLAAALNVFFRDVQPLLRLGVQLWFYASPVIYPVALVPKDLLSVYFLNPMAGVIEAYRAILLDGTPPGPYLYLAALVSFALLAGGYWFFKRLEPQFADII